MHILRIGMSVSFRQLALACLVVWWPSPSRGEDALRARLDGLMVRARARRVAASLVHVPSGRVLVNVGRSSKGPDRRLCLQPWAPAASVFKIVTAAALIESGVSPSERVCYAGGGLRRLKPRDLLDDPRRDSTCRTLSEALAHSTNVIFAKLAKRHLDPTILERYVEAFGFGERLSENLQPSPAEVPDDDMERARMAAGFFHVRLSPLHGALIAAAVARGGEMILPGRADGEPRRVIREETAAALRKMLLATTTDGTARKAFYDKRGRPYLGRIRVAGKTGSLAERGPFRDYSWFVGYAPANDPEVAVGVVVENGPKWWTRGHLLARDVLRAYFQEKSAGTLATR